MTTLRQRSYLNGCKSFAVVLKDPVQCTGGFAVRLSAQALLTLFLDAGAFRAADRIVSLALVFQLRFERADHRRMRRRIRGGKAGQNGKTGEQATKHQGP